MDPHVENLPRTFPPRPLTDDERQLLLDWINAAKGFSAFVSERHTDDPAIYRRIVVSRRATKQHLYLIHPPKDSVYWIIHSTVSRGYVERFPTLRAALNHIEPITAPARVARSSRVDRAPKALREPARRGSQAALRLKVLCWVCAVAAMLVVLRWLGSDGGIADGSRKAEDLAENTLQDSIGDPDGTQFRNVMAYRVGPDNERWVCGWFSAKNAVGEIVGPRRFAVHVLLTDRHPSGESSGVKTHLLMSETEVPSLSYVWENYCR